LSEELEALNCTLCVSLITRGEAFKIGTGAVVSSVKFIIEIMLLLLAKSVMLVLTV